jgi:hypothetical protein
MKKIIPILFLLISTSHIKAQKLVSNLSDMHKIKENEAMFINKPLSNLLSEIQPEIKKVIGSPKLQNGTAYNILIMYFITEKEKNKLEFQGKPILKLMIYVKEDFKWNVLERNSQSKIEWSEEDLIKYGNLTVVKISILND